MARAVSPLGMPFAVFGPLWHGLGTEDYLSYRRNITTSIFGAEDTQGQPRLNAKVGTVLLVELDPMVLRLPDRTSSTSKIVQIPKPYFEHFADARDENGFYYLPPHTIVAAVDLTALWKAPDCPTSNSLTPERTSSQSETSGDGDTGPPRYIPPPQDKATRASAAAEDEEESDDPHTAERAADRHALRTIATMMQQLARNDTEVKEYIEESTRESLSELEDDVEEVERVSVAALFASRFSEVFGVGSLRRSRAASKALRSTSDDSAEQAAGGNGEERKDVEKDMAGWRRAR